MLRLICGSALYIQGDPYETSDSVFGVKSSLIVDITKISDTNAALAGKYGMNVGDWVLEKDFVLTTHEEGTKLRVEQAKEALGKLGDGVKLVDGLPIAEDLD